MSRTSRIPSARRAALRARLGEILQAMGQSLQSVQWIYLLVALCFSATLWYGLTVRDKVETWVDARLEYRGMPPALVVRGRLVEKVSMRILAARGLSRSLNSRPHTILIDLSGVVKGTNTLPIEESMLPFTDAYEVMEISPARIQIIADTREVREIKVDAAFSGSLAQDFYVMGLQVTPESITVRGAESLVNGISRITVSVPLHQDMPIGSTELQGTIHVPEGVSSEPPVVDINMSVGIRTRPVRVLREVSLGIPEGMKARGTPSRISIQAELPESATHLASALNAITAMAEIPESAENGSTMLVPVRILLPENATLTSASPDTIKVTILEGGTPQNPVSEVPQQSQKEVPPPVTATPTP